MSERPYLILTLRRTGGTSVMTFLSRISGFPGLQHEPFNQGRVWGRLTEAFQKTGDTGALERRLARVLAPRPNIKHCFEFLPARLTLALIEACVARDYAVLLLTRRDEAGRLRSLFLAKATGAWGPPQAAEIYPRIRAGEMTLAPVDLAVVRRRAAEDAAALGQVLRFLRHRRIPHEWLLFEELYAPDDGLRDRARAIAAGIGLTIAADDPRLDVFAGQSGQGSGDILPFLPNAAALQALLQRLCPA